MSLRIPNPYVKQASQKYGVPYWIANDISLKESGGNPFAVGDNGSSFGLFQLHRGGQAGNLPTAALFNPQTNADIGVKNLSGAYNAGVKQGLTGFNLLAYTANNSGHPGNGGVAWTQKAEPSYDAGLQKIYNANGGDPNAKPGAPAKITNATPPTTGTASKTQSATTAATQGLPAHFVDYAFVGIGAILLLAAFM